MTEKSNSEMIPDEIQHVNNYMIKEVDEYRRRTKQMDIVGYDPTNSDLPRLNILDVSFMTPSNPHGGRIGHGRRNEQISNIYDHWNHLLYSNMRDMAKAEQIRKSQRVLHESAPEGSPYHNGPQVLPIL
jgi:hypothetical protein